MNAHSRILVVCVACCSIGLVASRAASEASRTCQLSGDEGSCVAHDSTDRALQEGTMRGLRPDFAAFESLAKAALASGSGVAGWSPTGTAPAPAWAVAAMACLVAVAALAVGLIGASWSLALRAPDLCAPRYVRAPTFYELSRAAEAETAVAEATKVEASAPATAPVPAIAPKGAIPSTTTAAPSSSRDVASARSTATIEERSSTITSDEEEAAALQAASAALKRSLGEGIAPQGAAENVSRKASKEAHHADEPRETPRIRAFVYPA